MPLQAVLFDLWETLIRDTPERGTPRRAWRAERVHAVLAAHGRDVELDTLLAALDATSHALTDLHDIGLDTDSRAGLFDDQLAKATGRRAPAAALPELEAVITVLNPDLAPGLAPHAIETLTALRALGLRTAIVSNAGFTTAPHLRSLLDHHGLTPHLEAILFSDELGVAKPDARIFRRALAALACEASAAAFVGDSPLNDVFGAQSAGIFAVQIGAKARDGIRPEARIDGLHELLPTLQARGLLVTSRSLERDSTGR